MKRIIGKMGLIFALAAVGIAVGAAGEPSGQEGKPRRSSAELRAAAVCYQRGLEAVRAGNWEAAAALMRASCELNPDFLPARFWMGRIQFEQQNWARAEEDFKALLAVKPQSLETHYWLGRVLEAVGRLEEAHQHYQIALQAGLKSEAGRDAQVRLQALRAVLPSPVEEKEAAGEAPAPVQLAERPGEKPKEAKIPESPVETPPPESGALVPEEREEVGPARPPAGPLPAVEEPAKSDQPAAERTESKPSPAEAEPPRRFPPTEPTAVPIARLDGAAAKAALLEKLQRQQPVQLLILGDTFTAAPGVPDGPAGGYPLLFLDLLEMRFPDLDLQAQAKGLTNATAAQGLATLKTEMQAQKPDLVVLHFGAYDQVGNVPVRAFQNALRQMVAAVAEAAPAALILATPLVEGPPDGPYVQAVKEVGLQAGAVVADFEAAVKGQGQDHRGLFPFGQHPHEYAHTAAAKELYRAFQQVIGELPTLQLTLQGPLQYVSWGAEGRLHFRISNRGPDPAQGQLRIQIDDATQEKPFAVPPGEEGTVEVPLPLPKELPHGRAQQIRLLAVAQAGAAAAVEVRWASVAQVLACPKVPGLIQFDEVGRWAEKLPQNPLGPGNVVTGQVDGPVDCRGSFRLAQDDEAICLLLEVQDDQYQPIGSNIAAFNDCVELFLDLRPQEQRGQPINTPQVFLLFIQLPTDPHGEAVVLPLDTRPPGLEQVEAVFNPTDDGYRLQIALPRAFLEQAARDEVNGFGFDLAIDDADEPGQRQAQLVWSGRADNFVNPRHFGEVSLQPEKDGKQVRMTVW